MDKVLRYRLHHMRMAIEASKMSYCKRRQVGAVVVKDNRIIVHSWNGKLPGLNNCCEEEVIVDGELTYRTSDDVIHAEENAILFAAKEGLMLKDTSIYITTAPCVKCARMIAGVGIKQVIYLSDYRCCEGLELLKSYGIEVIKLEMDE